MKSAVGPSVTIGSQKIALEKADTGAERELGLSGRSGLAKNTGMVFVFDRSENQCMWMKDMKFNLDIVWLDETGKVQQVQRNLSPATYPQSYCADARYVIELSAGGADAITTGQMLPLVL